jgi:tetratricopeptide (TPR) repeat protein
LWRRQAYRLVGAGQAEPALSILDGALGMEPSSAGLLRKRWLLQLRLGRYADALASGKALVATDSSAATSDYYERQLAAAKGAHDSVASHSVALETVARFPKNVDFLVTLARDAIDRGAPSDALPVLERALSIEPANTVAWQLTIAAHATSNGADSAVAAARRALLAGVSKDAVGASLVRIAAPAITAAQQSQKRADWEAALHIAQAVDTVASTQLSAYYVGVSAYQVASDDIQLLTGSAANRSPTRRDREAACVSATDAESLAAIVAISLPKGGSIDPATAGRILNALPGMSEFVSSVKRASCRSRPDE